MQTNAKPAWRFVKFSEAEIEALPNKTHYWYCRPEMVDTRKLMFVRCQIEPGHAHNFHFHPGLEEVLYVLAGRAEQWVGQESRLMVPGDSLFLGPEIIHATFNPGPDVLDFLAVLTLPAPGNPVTIEVGGQEPWKTLAAARRS